MTTALFKESISHQETTRRSPGLLELILGRSAVTSLGQEDPRRRYLIGANGSGWSGPNSPVSYAPTEHAPDEIEVLRGEIVTTDPVIIEAPNLPTKTTTIIETNAVDVTPNFGMNALSASDGGSSNGSGEGSLAIGDGGSGQSATASGNAAGSSGTGE
jgi:hypothetical protein